MYVCFSTKNTFKKKLRLFKSTLTSVSNLETVRSFQRLHVVIVRSQLIFIVPLSQQPSYPGSPGLLEAFGKQQWISVSTQHEETPLRPQQDKNSHVFTHKLKSS